MNINRNTLKNIIKEEMDKFTLVKPASDLEEAGKVLDTTQRASSQEMAKNLASKRKEVSASGMTAQEREIIIQVNNHLMDAAKEGNIAQGGVIRLIQMAMAKIKKLLGDPEAEDQQKP